MVTQTKLNKMIKCINLSKKEAEMIEAIWVKDAKIEYVNKLSAKYGFEPDTVVLENGYFFANFHIGLTEPLETDRIKVHLEDGSSVFISKPAEDTLKKAAGFDAIKAVSKQIIDSAKKMDDSRNEAQNFFNSCVRDCFAATIPQYDYPEECLKHAIEYAEMICKKLGVKYTLGK